MDPISNLSMDMSEMLMPWIALLLSIVITMWIKDWVQSFVKGMQFRINKAFNEGDHVILDGVPAHIVKIGNTETVFGVYSDRGYTWRYVPNSRIPFLKLEKIVNAELHLDTEFEKGQKLQKLIDEVQDDKISSNRQEIEKLKNGG